jgi:hypothetical protein
MAAVCLAVLLAPAVQAKDGGDAAKAGKPAKHDASAPKKPHAASKSKSDAPMCHSGPRGGNYTINKDGKKQYGSC